MARIDKNKAPAGSGTRYPSPHDVPVRQRSWLRLGDAAGLTQFGVNLVRLPPGAWSSQRHWHSHEDEFVYVLKGELVLVTDAGEELMQVGDCAGFKAGVRDGHCLQNRSTQDAEFLVVGSRVEEDFGEYPDIDMMFLPGDGGFRRRGRLGVLTWPMCSSPMRAAMKARVAPWSPPSRRRAGPCGGILRLQPGQEFDRQIAAELPLAAVVVVWTPTSVESRWVRGEARDAPIGASWSRCASMARNCRSTCGRIHTTNLDGWGDNPSSPPVQELLRCARRA